MSETKPDSNENGDQNREAIRTRDLPENQQKVLISTIDSEEALQLLNLINYGSAI